MTTSQLIILDTAVTLAAAICWLAAGATAAAARVRLSSVVALVAAVATLGRAATLVALADRGWWFVQEKVIMAAPLLGVAAVVAAVLAGPALLTGITVPVRAVVALFTAGYAGVCGLLLTYVAGFPLTWSKALIALSLVITAALLTWRVVATGDQPAPVESKRAEDAPASSAPRPALPHGRATPASLSRRRFMGLAGATVAAGTGATGAGLLFAPAPTVDAGGGPSRTAGARSTISVADLRGAEFPGPGRNHHRHVITAKQTTVSLASGREIQAWTYDGQVPGPPITAVEGDLIEVTLRNSDIDDGVTIHWHGYDIACGEDGAPGVTQPVVLPGEEFVYRFRANQVGTYWYHTHQASHRGVRLRLYGTLVVTPRADDVVALDLTLPVHTFDGRLVVGLHDQRREHAADVGAPVRLRLINTDSDPHRMALAGTPFRIAAVDGRNLNEPSEIQDVALRLPAGGRYDLTFTMPDTPVALVVDGDHDGGVKLVPGDDPESADTATDTAPWPEQDLLGYGTPAPLPFDADGEFDREFTLVLDRGIAMVDGGPAYAHTVNGRGHPSIPDQLVAEGDLVHITVINRSLETHPWHLHGHPVAILARDGRRVSGSPLWMDTFDVQPGEVWEVAFRADNPGVWMNHCHNLPHAHQGMMLRVVYDDVTTPFGGTHAEGHPSGTVSHGH